MENLVLFNNPHSGANLRDKSRIKRMQKIVGNKGIVHNTKDLESLEKVISDLYRQKPKAVIISGGDMTTSYVITLMKKHWPEGEELPGFAALPSGTFSILAKESAHLKEKRKMRRLFLTPGSYFNNWIRGENPLEYLNDIVKSGDDDLFYRDVGLMKVTDNHDNLVYGFSFGTGLTIDLLQEYYTAKRLKWYKVSSMLIRLVSSALFNGNYYRKFNKQEPFSINGEEPENYIGIMAQTLKSIGLPKSTPFYKAELSPGKFHALGFRMNLAKFMRYFPAFYAGDQIPGSLDVQTDYIAISSEKEFLYNVNGDLDFFGKPLMANLVKIEHGLVLKMVQPRGNI